MQDCSMTCDAPAKCNSFMLNVPIAPVSYSDCRFDVTSYLPSVIQSYLQSHTNSPIDIYFLDVLLLAKCQLLKSSEWSYEQEWRLAYRSASTIYEPHKCIGKLKPSAIYLGTNMAPDNMNTTFGICQSKQIPCYIMMQNYTGHDYTLQVQPYEDYLKATGN